MALIAETFKEDGRLAKPGIVATVMSNLGLERYLAGLGADARAHAGRRPLRARADARARLQSSAASSPATSSCPTSRPPATASSPRCRCWRWCSKLGQPVSEVCHRFEPLPQVLKSVRYKSGKPLENAKVRIARSSDGERRLNGHGRLLVRPSGTEPVIRVMGEGDDQVLVEEVVDGIVEALSRGGGVAATIVLAKHRAHASALKVRRMRRTPTLDLLCPYSCSVVRSGKGVVVGEIASILGRVPRHERRRRACSRARCSRLITASRNMITDSSPRALDSLPEGVPPRESR